jgi:hypothetical protein
MAIGVLQSGPGEGAFQPFQPTLDSFQPILDALDLRLNQGAEIIKTVGYVGAEIVNAFIQMSDAAILKVDPEQVPTCDYGDLRPAGEDRIHGIPATDSAGQLDTAAPNAFDSVQGSVCLVITSSALYCA